MLLLADSLRKLSFSALMEVYASSNRELGAALAPDASPERQLQLAEQDFYCYLHDVFFSLPGSRYAVWIQDGRYVSALRLEPFQDGLLLTGLETAPQARRRGYAVQLIQAVQDTLAEGGKLYSHVSRKNTVSLKTHRRCAFLQCLDYAVYLDGSVDRSACTLLFEKNFQKLKKSD